MSNFLEENLISSLLLYKVGVKHTAALFRFSAVGVCGGGREWHARDRNKSRRKKKTRDHKAKEHFLSFPTFSRLHFSYNAARLFHLDGWKCHCRWSKLCDTCNDSSYLIWMNMTRAQTQISNNKRITRERNVNFSFCFKQWEGKRRILWFWRSDFIFFVYSSIHPVG